MTGYFSQREENFYRLSKLLVNDTTRVLKRVLYFRFKRYTKSDMPTDDNSWQTIPNIITPRPYSNDFRSLTKFGIYDNGYFKYSPEKWDITVLLIVLRNSYGFGRRNHFIRSNFQGWDPFPNYSVANMNTTSPEEVIRVIRNEKYGHVKTAEIPNPVFQRLSKWLIEALIRLYREYTPANQRNNNLRNGLELIVTNPLQNKVEVIKLWKEISKGQASYISERLLTEIGDIRKDVQTLVKEKVIDRIPETDRKLYMLYLSSLIYVYYTSQTTQHQIISTINYLLKRFRKPLIKDWPERLLRNFGKHKIVSDVQKWSEDELLIRIAGGLDMIFVPLGKYNMGNLEEKKKFESERKAAREKIHSILKKLKEGRISGRFLFRITSVDLHSLGVNDFRDRMNLISVFEEFKSICFREENSYYPISELSDFLGLDSDEEAGTLKFSECLSLWSQTNAHSSRITEMMKGKEFITEYLEVVEKINPSFKTKIQNLNKYLVGEEEELEVDGENEEDEKSGKKEKLDLKNWKLIAFSVLPILVFEELRNRLEKENPAVINHNINQCEEEIIYSSFKRTRNLIISRNRELYEIAWYYLRLPSGLVNLKGLREGRRLEIPAIKGCREEFKNLVLCASDFGKQELSENVSEDEKKKIKDELKKKCSGSWRMIMKEKIVPKRECAVFFKHNMKNLLPFLDLSPTDRLEMEKKKLLEEKNKLAKNQSKNENKKKKKNKKK